MVAPGARKRSALIARVTLGLMLAALLVVGVGGAATGEPLLAASALALGAAVLLIARDAPNLVGGRAKDALPAARRVAWVAAGVLGVMAAIGTLRLVLGGDASMLHLMQATSGGLVLLFGGIAYSHVHLRTRDLPTRKATLIPVTIALSAYVVLATLGGTVRDGLAGQFVLWLPAVIAILFIATGGRLPGSTTRPCPECLRPNAPDALHCDGCGAVVGLPCGGCGRANLADARHCGGCGRELAQPSSSFAATRPST